MKITRYNYGSLLPSEDDIMEQGRNFGEHEKSCDEVANILFPIIDELTARCEKMREALNEAEEITKANCYCGMLKAMVKTEGNEK